MREFEDEAPASDPTAQAFGLIGYGVLAAMLWLPWVRFSAGLNLLGYILMFAGLMRIGKLNFRFEVARWILCGAAFFALIDTLSGPGLQLVRGTFSVSLPATLQLRDYFLGAAVWAIAGGLIELASAKSNFEIRDAAAGRRDLYLVCLVAEGLLIGPLLYSVSEGVISGGAYDLIAVFGVLFRCVVAFLWMVLCGTAAKGFEPEEGAI